MDWKPGAVLRIGEDARLTPLAADIVNEKKIEIVRRASRRGSKASKIIAVGADHGGFKMKEELKGVLGDLGHKVQDFGAYSEEAVDYPDFAHAVARAVANGTADLGIVIDGAGVGSAMTANKVPGVRAAACYSVEVARNSREHNDANVLTLGSKTISSAQMRDIVIDLAFDRDQRRATSKTRRQDRRDPAAVPAINPEVFTTLQRTSQEGRLAPARRRVGQRGQAALPDLFLADGQNSLAC